MKYHDLRDFLALLEQQGELKRITLPVDPHLEITEIADRTLRAGGPALLFENPKGYSMPVLVNLFGTPKRVAMGMGQQDVSATPRPVLPEAREQSREANVFLLERLGAKSAVDEGVMV